MCVFVAPPAADTEFPGMVDLIEDGDGVTIELTSEDGAFERTWQCPGETLGRPGTIVLSGGIGNPCEGLVSFVDDPSVHPTPILQAAGSVLVNELIDCDLEFVPEPRPTLALLGALVAVLAIPRRKTRR